MLTAVEGIYENGVIRLLEPLSGIDHARVVVTVLPSPHDDAHVVAAAPAHAAFQPQSELGRRLFAIRQQALAAGMTTRTQDEVLAEVCQRRDENE